MPCACLAQLFRILCPHIRRTPKYRSQNTVLRMDLKEHYQVHACLYIVRLHNMYMYAVHVRCTFNTQQAPYQFWRGPCDACAADHVINSSKPSPSVFPPPHLILDAQCAWHGGGRRSGNKVTMDHYCPRVAILTLLCTLASAPSLRRTSAISVCPCSAAAMRAVLPS